MRIDSAMATGVQGSQRAEQLAGRASSQIARLNTPAGEQVALPEELVNLKVADPAAQTPASPLAAYMDRRNAVIARRYRQAVRPNPPHSVSQNV